MKNKDTMNRMIRNPQTRIAGNLRAKMVFTESTEVDPKLIEANERRGKEYEKARSQPKVIAI